MIDFTKLKADNTVDTIIKPRELFSALPQKDAKYQYPRDVQSQVWKQWYEQRDQKSIVLKMNTGSGKTVVGLLILKSSLNEGKGPAVYVVPDNFLVDQVINEANSMDIPVTTDANSTAFKRGKSILVCNIHKLVNGKSVFGVGAVKISIGSIIIDDAHACIDTVETQYTVKISKDNPAYANLLQLFLPSIKEQNETKAIELENEQPDTIALLPFWSWKNNLSEVTKILIANSTHDDLLFSFPLIKNDLKYCRCVVSDKGIEITPHCIPIDRIPSLENAQRKIFMTATLIDDSILSTHFDLGLDEISNVITPDTAGDIGDRMIMVPQELNAEITDDELKTYYKMLSTEVNVVIIVPSAHRAKYWNDVVDMTINKNNIQTEINNLKNTHIGLVLLVNRYDGIDLPGSACRVLVIDGLPDSRRMIDQITESQLTGSQKVVNTKIQKIEQGMGRGVRSNDDHCIVFLMGKNLIHHLYTNGAINKFSQATKAQFELSEEISEQLADKPLKDIHEAVKYALERNPEWISISKSRLASLVYQDPQHDNFSISQREAYNAVKIHQYTQATTTINDAIGDIEKTDKAFIGYAKQILAEYVNYTNEVEAQNTLLSAIKDNKNILKPKEGIVYERIKTVDNQANTLQKFLLEQYGDDYSKFKIDLDSILEDLIFLPDTSNRFEEAFKNLASFLGFSGQRPEIAYKRGPDVLWSTGHLNYFIIECKNGATNPLINKHDVNQLNGSIAWFKEEYDDTCKSSAIMIHPGDTCEHAASPLPGCSVLKLNKFKQNINAFSLALRGNFNNLETIKALLIHHQLRDSDIKAVLCKPIIIK